MDDGNRHVRSRGQEGPDPAPAGVDGPREGQEDRRGHRGALQAGGARQARGRLHQQIRRAPSVTRLPAGQSDPLISARSLTKIYEAARGHRVLALEAVSFDVNQGEFVTLVGPSGCGMSTLLRLIAGLQPATAGELYVDGKKVEGPVTVGIVFQTPVLMPWMSVLANILLPIEILKLDRDDGRREALEL